MLGDLETYSLSHFMPMTPEVYFRLFERLNSQLWPWQLLVFALFLAGAEALRRGRSVMAGVLVALCWLWVALAFQFSLHGELSPAGAWLGWAFVLQALLLLVAGWRGQLVGQRGPRARVGLALLVFALFLYPLLGPLTVRTWAGLEVPGTAPDPTLMATLALLVMTPRLPWLLVPVPVLALVFSAATWWTLGWEPGLVVGLLAILFLLCPLIGRLRQTPFYRRP
ncbi:MAG: DUF6064 family protein [Oleiphilaceae bacterium]|nr:DUF6064 family protein [Oleiphilaceae bacterium]